MGPLDSSVADATQFSPEAEPCVETHSDGRVKFASNLAASLPGITPANAFDRLYVYDHLGRLTDALTGPEARGETPPPGPINSPYRQTNGYDAWGNLTSRNTRYWRSYPSDSGVYVNDRRQGWIYDNAGNKTDDGFIKDNYDAAGRHVRVENWSPFVGGGLTGNPQAPSIEITQELDGDGRPIKRIETRRTETPINGGPATHVTTTVTTTWYVRLGILGGEVALELNEHGALRKAHIYALGGRIAEKVEGFGLFWRHINPVTGTMVKAGSGGGIGTDNRTEYDPLGAETGNYDPWVNDPTPTYLELKGAEPLYVEGGDPFNVRSGCSQIVDGLPRPCSDVARLLNSGSLEGQLTYGGMNIGSPRVVNALPGGGFYLPAAGTGLRIFDDDGNLLEEEPATLSILPSLSTGKQKPPKGFVWVRLVTEPAILIPNPNPCEVMAAIAQFFANKAIAMHAGANSNALSDFNLNLANLYVGASIGSTFISAVNFWRAWPKPIQDMAGFSFEEDGLIRGDQGFKKQFHDTANPGEDQTHHFVAYLDSGVNNQSVATFLHSLRDSDGDVDLGMQAFSIGERLRKDPALLVGIQRRILGEICDGQRAN